MNSKERFQAALNLETPDRVPLLYQHLGGGEWVLQSAGKSLMEGFQSPEAFAEIAMASQRLFEFDNVMVGWGDILIEAQAHGAKWAFKDKNQYPHVEAYVPFTPESIERIQPVDPLKDEYWSVPLRAAGILQEKIGEGIEVVGCINAPFIIASEVIGYDKIMVAPRKNPKEAHKLFETITESAKIYADRIAQDYGLDTLFIVDGTAGADQIGLDFCTQFDLYYVGKLIDHCRSLGLKTIIQNGSSAPYLEAQAALKPDAIHFNNRAVDLAKTFDMFRQRLCVVSGIDHMELLLRGTPDDVEREVQRAVDLYGKASGLMLAAGAEMGFKTPVENIRRLKEAAARYGSY